MSQCDLKAKLRAILQEQLETRLPDNDDDVSMGGLTSWDSMAQVRVVLAIEGVYGIEADSELIQADSLKKLHDCVQNRTKAI